MSIKITFSHGSPSQFANLIFALIIQQASLFTFTTNHPVRYTIFIFNAFTLSQKLHDKANCEKCRRPNLKFWEANEWSIQQDWTIPSPIFGLDFFSKPYLKLSQDQKSIACHEAPTSLQIVSRGCRFRNKYVSYVEPRGSEHHSGMKADRMIALGVNFGPRYMLVCLTVLLPYMADISQHVSFIYYFQ